MMLKRGSRRNKTSFFPLVLIVLLCVQYIPMGCFEKESQNDTLDMQLLDHGVSDDPLILPDWVDGQYHDYTKTTQLLRRFNDRYPDLVDVFSIGKSVQNRDIWCIKITNEQNTSSKGSCVIDGCIHGCEWEAGEICLYLAEYLLINFERNNSVAAILNSSTVYLIPLLNPDGRENNERYNENGIDLNRNFDVHFGGLRGGNFPLGKLFGIIKIPYIHLPRKDITYTNCGRKPFSEPETAAFYKFMHSIKDLSFYVNCHTALHGVGSLVEIEKKPEYTISYHEKEILTSTLSWIENNTQYSVWYPIFIVPYGIGVAHHWVFKEFHVPSYFFELLSEKYEPGYVGGGFHDDLVYWMEENLPVLLFLLANIKQLHRWDFPENEPVLPKVTSLSLE